jgi:hypothetical protein
MDIPPTKDEVEKALKPNKARDEAAKKWDKA